MNLRVVLCVLLLTSPATAQSVQQSGTVTRGHVAVWNTSGVIADGGSSASSPISSIGVTNNGSCGIGINSALPTSAAWQHLCFGVTTAGVATISLQNFGTAPVGSFQFVVNGAAQGFPTVSPLPVVVGDLACFGATSGGLTDCGTAPSTVPLVVGTTPVTGAVANGLLFNNAGLLGSLPTGTNVASALGNPLNGTGGLVGFSGNIGAASGTSLALSGTLSANAVNLPNTATPQQFGALANSNGTHGNGNDDTAAFQAALTASANGTLVVPCGTYRITSGIGESTLATYDIEGMGSCSKIYFDTTTAETLFSIAPATDCQLVAPCLKIIGLNFITPNTVSSSTRVLDLTNMPGLIFSDNEVDNYGIAILLIGTDFSPLIEQNTFQSLQFQVLVCSADASCNNLRFWNNKVFSTAVQLATIGFSTTACTTQGVSIIGNDVEGNAAGFNFEGVCAGSLLSNYMENNGSFPFFWGAGGNQAFSLQGNHVLETTAVSVASTGLAGLDLNENQLDNLSITSGATNVSCTNNALTDGATTPVCPVPAGTGNPVLSNSPTLITPNIGAATGTSLALGGATIGSNALAVNGTFAFSAGGSFDGALTGITTASMSGQLTSTLATGTAPFSVASTTNVPNLNASSLNGATFASPGAIGGSTPNTGSFTALIAKGSPPTLSGTCTAGTQVGGNTAGTFKASAACTAGTVILTFATTAPNGWVCTAHDQTTPADAMNQTANAATSCTLTGTMVSGDVIAFDAQAF